MSCLLFEIGGAPPACELLGEGRKAAEPSLDLKVGSKLSSWLPAMTTLCGCGSVPSQWLNSLTSERCPQRVKSPAWMRRSPGGTGRLMCDVSEWVSLRQTTRTCQDVIDNICEQQHC